MRKLLLSAVAAATLFTASCSEDFDVAAPYKQITIVYAMLNIDSTNNYIRIQKAFMDQDKSAIDMAKVADSNFYKENEIEVVIRELVNGNIVNNMPLPRVDMHTIYPPKDSGTFFTNPNYAYRYTKQLNDANTYRLVIKNLVTGDVDSAETGVIPSDTTQNKFFVLAFGSGGYPPQTVKFTNTTAASHKYTLSVSVAPPARIVEGVIRFFYWEKNTTLNTEVQKYVDFPFAEALVNNKNAELVAPNSAFYSFFRDELGTAPGNIERYLDSCDIYVYASSADYYDYRNITQAQLNGLTTNEIKPIYTNLKGTDVFGLFSTRAVRIGRNIQIEPLTLDSLAKNPITQPTGIQPDPSDK